MAKKRAAVPAAVIAAYVREIEQAFDRERLDSYSTPDGNPLGMVTTYFWNVALCKELYPVLGGVEVTMRNAIHDTLVVSRNAPDWYDEPGLLGPREAEAIRKAKQDIVAAGKAIVPGRVVAAVTFGFWTGMLSSLYGESPKGTPLWTRDGNALLGVAFPHLAPRLRHRSYVHRRFNTIRLLRNRIMHHEPIWQDVRLQSGALIDLETLHRDMLEAIGWVDPAVRASIAALDRFPACLHRGRRAIEAELTAYLRRR
jgi:hypothetical protein